MIPPKLSERLAEMGQNADKIYYVRTIKAGLSGTKEVPWMKGFYFIDDVSEKIEIPGLNFSRGMSEWRGHKFPNSEKFLRIWPYQNNTNGMFVARVRKKD